MDRSGIHVSRCAMIFELCFSTTSWYMFNSSGDWMKISGSAMIRDRILSTLEVATPFGVLLVLLNQWAWTSGDPAIPWTAVWASPNWSEVSVTSNTKNWTGIDPQQPFQEGLVQIHTQYGSKDVGDQHRSESASLHDILHLASLQHRRIHTPQEQQYGP